MLEMLVVMTILSLPVALIPLAAADQPGVRFQRGVGAIASPCL